MNSTSDTALMAERLESVKAGIIGGFCLGGTSAIATLLNHLLLARFFPVLGLSSVKLLNLEFLIGLAIAGFCGLLFGVTWRYIVRSDDNPQLKAGGVMAFGLVRGLSQVDMGLKLNSDVLPLVVLPVESILSFAVCAIAIDAAMQFGFVKPFESSN